MSIEAMKLAEAALFGPWDGCVNSIEGRAITALRQAIEQAEQPESEAVRAAWLAGYTEGERYAIEQAEQAQPVALEAVYETIIRWDEGGGKRSRRALARRIFDHYTAPPPRQPLTDEQRQYVVKMWKGGNWTAGDIIDAVEAAHQIGVKK